MKTNDELTNNRNECWTRSKQPSSRFVTGRIINFCASFYLIKARYFVNSLGLDPTSLRRAERGQKVRKHFAARLMRRRKSLWVKFPLLNDKSLRSPQQSVKLSACRLELSRGAPEQVLTFPAGWSWRGEVYLQANGWRGKVFLPLMNAVNGFSSENVKLDFSSGARLSSSTSTSCNFRLFWSC